MDSNDITSNDFQEYVDDFWDTFSEQEKAELKLEGFEQRLYGIVLEVDFKTKRLVARKDMR